MLFKLSIKNITKSIKDYAIYFFTLVLGVAIFYVFNAIDSQTVMLNVSSSTSEIIRLMTTILGGVSVFVSFILGFLIIYASRFLIKRRNKEFGIYLTLGMSKRKISLILFFETLIIGVISLGVGLALGIVLSQLMSILVANMFEADLTKFQFTFSSSAALKTLLYFSIMYLIVMIFNTIIVNKCKLIDLLHGNKKSEKVKLKNPIICTIVFIIAVIALSYAYYLVTDGFGTSPLMNTISGILIPIALGCVSTFLIFWSLSGLILKIVMHLKKYYYKGLNSFTVRQISSKINTTVFSMTIICLMLFFTICIFSSALSIKNSLSGNLKDLAPVDIQFSKLQESLSKEEKENFSKEIIEDYNTTVKDTLQRLDVYKYLKDVVDINIYRVEEITLKDSFGDQIEQIGKDYPTLAYNVREDLVKLSDYNRLAKLYNQKELTLKDNEYVIIANYKMMADIRNIALKNNTKLTINSKNYYPKYQKCQDGIIELSGSATNTGVIILPDNALEGIHPYKNVLAANYQADTKEEKENVKTQYDAQIKNCRSSLELAKLDIQSLEETIREASLKAPISGTVTFVEKSLEGGYANQENLLVTIRAAKKNRFSCKTEYTSRFSQGSEVTVTVMGQQYKTTVKKGKGKQIYFVPKQELALKNAVTGTVDLVLKEKKNVLYVPSALVFDMGSKKVVYIEGKEGVKETREVTTGEQIQNEIEITGGLKENEQILTN